MSDIESMVRRVLTNVKPKGIKSVYKVTEGMKLKDLPLKVPSADDDYLRMRAARTWIPYETKGKVCLYDVPPFGTGIALSDENDNVTYLFSPAEGATSYENVTSEASETSQDAFIFIEVFLEGSKKHDEQ